MNEPDHLDRPVHNHYRLNAQGEPVKCKTLREWCASYEASFRDGVSVRVLKKDRVGACLVSTVFLALDHSFGEGPPLLWETMVFADAPDHPEHYRQTRCAGGREQAEAMHARMVEEMKKVFAPTESKTKQDSP